MSSITTQLVRMLLSGDDGAGGQLYFNGSLELNYDQGSRNNTEYNQDSLNGPPNYRRDYVLTS